MFCAMQLLPIQQLLVLGELNVVHGPNTKRQPLSLVKKAIFLRLRLHTQRRPPSIVCFVWNDSTAPIEVYGAKPLFAILRTEHLKVCWPADEVAKERLRDFNSNIYFLFAHRCSCLFNHWPTGLNYLKSTAQNMHLCGMPSTQVQRAARRIAAGPLAAILGQPPNSDVIILFFLFYPYELTICF